MKQFVSLFVFAILLCSTTLAQEQTRATGAAKGSAQTQAEAANEASSLAAGTQLSAELLSTLDAKQAQPGEQFKMRTLKPVMMNGKQIVAKGTVLVGHVVEATRAKSKEDVSQLKLSFDQLRNKNLTLPFSATIEQITQATVNHQAQLESLNNDLGLAGASTSQTSAAGRASGNTGGLLGGVTNTVGSTVGGVVGTTTGAVNNTVGGVTATTQQTTGVLLGASAETLNSTAGRTTGLIAISSDTNAEAGSSSMLTLTGRNVKVEKGAIFTLRTDKTLNITAERPQQ